jgi:hypothetical protein
MVVGKTQMPIKRWMDKEIVVYPYNGIWPSYKKKWIININSMDESQENCTKWEKKKNRRKKENLLDSSIYVKV